MRACVPQSSGWTISRNVWSRAIGAGKAKRRSGCAEALPTGYGPCADAVQAVIHLRLSPLTMTERTKNIKRQRRIISHGSGYISPWWRVYNPHGHTMLKRYLLAACATLALHAADRPKIVGIANIAIKVDH